MLTSPPREKEWVSWLLVVVWALIILFTVPLARALQEWIVALWGSESFFTYAVIVVILAATAAAALRVRRAHLASPAGYAWLLGVAAVFVGCTISLSTHPVEATHFVQYGLLSLLMFRALSYRLRDAGIYFTAALLAGILGTIDETVQWAVPRRVWGLRDIGLNMFAASLTQLALAKGLRPSFITGGLGPQGIRYLCRSGMAAVVLLGLSFLNSPEVIRWYADRWPALAFLKHNDTMFEYGYRYEDPEIGTFRSRLPPEKLRRTDAERGAEAARIVDRYPDDAAYMEFLDTYTAIADPFVHEARVHMFRRDRYLAEAQTYAEGSEEFREALTVAYRENQILEQYFKRTLNHSSYVLPPGTVAFMERHLLPELDYDSGVSRSLATSFGHLEVALAVVLALLALLFIDRRYGRCEGARGDA